jgi:hypothetical protein
VVIEIARALRDPSEIAFAWDVPNLVKGAAGHAMLFWYLADCDLVEDAAETAERFEQRARTLITREPGMLSLFYGLTGVGAAAICSPRIASRPYAEKLCRTIDHVLVQTLRTPWKGGFDLFYGLVGLGVYAGLRVEEPTSREILERIVEQLEGFAEVTPEGLAWRMRPHHVPSPNVRQLTPDGYFDLGLAHGAPGVIALLSHCVHLGADAVRARRLVTQTLPWLRSQRNPDPAPLHYRSRALPGEPPGRVAWCHSDLSVAIAMLAAGRLLEVPEWEREAIDLARGAANCPPSRDGIFNTSLLEGTAGVGHALSRMAVQTGDSVLEDGARRWLVRTLRMLPSDDAMAGFPSRDPATADRKTGHTLLSGAAGVALALAAAIGSAPPDWDRVFLLSWPGPGDARATSS